MQVTRVDDVREFLDVTEPLLLADEARHNLMLGIAGTIRNDPSVYPEYRLWVASENGEAVGAALRTPPFHLVLARPRDPAAVDALAREIEDDLPGVVGAVPEVHRFVDAWVARTGVAPQPGRAQGVYKLEQVVPPPPTPGRLRPAEKRDRELLCDWWQAFAAEALDDERRREDFESAVDHRLQSEHAGLMVWEDGQPVSFSGWGGETPNGIRIGPVYTPPELRGRGYASALVAELSQRLLDSGRRFCFLYTDLANPTANRIYMRIGYERVCDSAEIAFERQTQTRK